MSAVLWFCETPLGCCRVELAALLPDGTWHIFTCSKSSLWTTCIGTSMWLQKSWWYIRPSTQGLCKWWMVPWMQVISAVSPGVQHSLKSLWSSGEVPRWHFNFCYKNRHRENQIPGERGHQEAAWHFSRFPVIVLLSLNPKHWIFSSEKQSLEFYCPQRFL